MRSLRLRWSSPGAEFLLISLIFLAISFAVIMASNAKLSTKPIVLKAIRPLNAPGDLHLSLNTVCTSLNGRPHLRDSMSSRIIPASFPLCRWNSHRKCKNCLHHTALFFTHHFCRPKGHASWCFCIRPAFDTVDLANRHA